MMTFKHPCIRRLLACLLIGLACPSALHATTYWVAPNGSDTLNSGTSQASPFKTIQKAADMMLAAGDICNIRAGTYRETVTAKASNLTFQAYGSEVVTISGTESVTGWQVESPNIYYASMTGSLGDGNQVFQNGAMKPLARWPNAGATYPWENSSLAHPAPYNQLGTWSYADTAGYTGGINGWFTDAQLPSRADGYWNNATVHIMGGYGWIMQSPTVTGYTNATKTLVTNDPNGANAAYAIAAGKEYYLTGKKGEMDSAGEWFYDSALSRLYFYSTTTPANVEAKKRNYGFNLSGRSNIKLMNLDFFACTIQTDANSTYATFDGLNMKFLGHSRKNSPVFGLALRNGCVLRNSELSWDSRGLVQLAGNDIRAINNHFHDSGYVPTWDAMIQGYGYRNLVSHNTLHDAGRAAMGSAGRSAIVEYNDMYNAMRLTTDGGVFYTYLEAGNSIVRYNLMHDSPGPVGHNGAPVEGFYLDSQNSNWIVHHNVIWGVPGHAMQFNARQNFNMIFNNTCRNTGSSLLSAFTQDGETGTNVFNNLFNGAPIGGSWGFSDLRYNLYTDPLFVSGTSRLQSTSPAIDQGIVIPGITDGHLGSAPDLGAMEYGGTDWTVNAGYKTTPPSPDPTYTMPAMIFANKVKDGSFESGSLSPNWTASSGSNVVLFNAPPATAWTDVRFRTGAYSLKFGQGTSEIRQTVTGLQSGWRYKVYAGIQTTDATAKIYVGVRNYGFSALEFEALGGTGGAWEMLDLPFFTGGTSTSAEIYVKVVSTSASVPVYIDDLSMEVAQENTDPQPYGMPVVSYPFDESSGLTAHDATTNARDASLTNTTFAPGLHGNALQFNGTSSYGSASSVTVPSASDKSFTVAFRVKFDDTGTKTPALVSNNNGGWLKKGWYVCANENRSIGMYLWPTDNPPSGVSAWSSQMAATGVWTHVAYSVDRSKGVLNAYRDGALVASSTIPAGFGDIDTASGLRLGSTSLKGQMEDFRLWNYALTTKDIAAVSGSDDSLFVRLKLDENAGATKAWDASGNGLNGTLTSMNTTTCWTGGALQFNSSGYVQCPPPVAPSPGGSFSVSFWVKFDDAGAGTGIPPLASNNNGGWLKKGWLVIANENRNIGMYLWTQDNGSGGSNPPTSITSWTSPVSPGTWTHLAYTVDRENGVFSRYRNGALESTTVIPAGFGDVDTLLGPRFGSSPLKGQLDDIRIYKRALTWYEIMEILNQIDEPPYY